MFVLGHTQAKDQIYIFKPPPPRPPGGGRGLKIPVFNYNYHYIFPMICSLWKFLFLFPRKDGSGNGHSRCLIKFFHPLYTSAYGSI